MTKNYKTYMLSMLGIGLSLTTSFAMEERLSTNTTNLKSPAHQRLSPTHVQNDYISTLPDELKQNILTRLDSKSLAAISAASKNWHNQAHDGRLLKSQEKDYQKVANKAGIMSKYNPHETWRNTYTHRNDKEWVFNNFKRGVRYFELLADKYDCHIGSFTIHPDAIREILKYNPSGDFLAKELDDKLSSMTGRAAALYPISLSNDVTFHSHVGKDIMRDLEESGDHRVLELLKYKHLTSVEDLGPQEILAFCAYYEIPAVAPSSSSDFSTLVSMDKNDPKVITAIRSSYFFDSVRQFIKDYPRIPQISQQQPQKETQQKAHQYQQGSQQTKQVTQQQQTGVNRGKLQQPKQYASYMGPVKDQAALPHPGMKYQLNFYDQFRNQDKNKNK